MRHVPAGLALSLALLAPSVALAQRNLNVAPAAAGEQRVALVIGNSGYADSPLRNPVNDARAMAQALQRLGFTVIKRENLKAKEIGPALREFRSRLSAGATALFFYAGHGLQVKGVNYLPTVDAEIDAEEDVPTQSLNVNAVFDLMEEAKTRVNLVLLDACRNNPFTRRFRSAAGGLAKVDAASGTLISFATRPGSVAADGEGANGLYTEHLLRHMNEAGVPIEQVLKRVGSGVKLASKGRQEPWSEGLIEGEFYFRAPASVGAPAAVPAAVQAVDPAALEIELWNSVKDSRSADELKAYLDQYPSGRFAAVAKARLRVLAAPPAAQVASAAPSVAATRPPAAPGSIAAMTPGTAFRDCDVCPEMVVIPAGSFTMGSPASEQGRFDNEGPQHQVNIGRPFAAGKYEVTFDEWDACMREGGCSHNPSDNGWGRGRRPVINVSWEDARSYTEWLSRKTGQRYGLPTEAQWEYAARAGTTTAFSFGSSINPQQANYDSGVSYAGSPTAVSRRQSVPVGSYPANAFGLHDVHGNVWEWTEDCVNSNYNGAPSDGSAWTSDNCGQRVLRGGSWDYNTFNARSANRISYIPSDRLNSNGFRIARTD